MSQSADPRTGATTTTRQSIAALGEHAQFLADIPLFATLDLEELRELASVTRRHTFGQGEIIFHRDDPGATLFVIKSGRVRIFISSPEGQEVALAVFGPGEAFGELALLDGQPRSASAIAIEPVESYTIQRGDFIAVATRRPRIALQMLATLSRRLRQTDAMVEDLLFLDVHGRVAKKLLELAETNGTRTPEGIRIEMKLTQSDLAAMVGASRESVNKVMSYLLDKQYVSVEKRKITVMRLTELRKRIC
ncbi:MAG: Crp/Fnr family transcriptional regulator [Chloroflexota bacterium]|nr:Crp/Fnr family transcriptional regulator [Chloroflexota bacterium]